MNCIKNQKQMNVNEIDIIDFGIFSESEILKMSVAEINNNRLPPTKNSENTIGTLYDVRMGPMETKKICVTCRMETKDCSGHFGHIKLNVKVVHPFFYKHTIAFLKCVCIQCSRLLVTHDMIKLWGLDKYNGEQRFTRIIDKIVNLRFCLSCSIAQPKYTLSNDSMFMATYKIKNQTNQVKLSVDEIYSILNNISDDDVCLLGFNPDRMHPVNIILTYLPVLPPRSRPFIVADNISDDDLTLAYAEIIKTNNYIGREDITETQCQKYIETLIFRIKTLFDNSAGKAKHSNARSMKGYKERLSGKDGLIRENLMGKRVNYSARTVIGPDPTLRVDEIAVPEYICDLETFPENVNQWNIASLQEMVFRGEISIIDKPSKEDQTIQKIRRIHTKFALENPSLRTKLCTLQFGDVVHRKIRDGDIVILNRQPTLHKGSMLAKRIVRRPCKTIRMNLATTATFNADFDGDEMNLFFPQSYMSRVELEELSATKHNMIGAQMSSPVITIVQDALLSCFLMTKDNTELDRSVFFQLVMRCDTDYNTPGGISYDVIQHKLSVAKKIFQKHNKNYPSMCGKTLFSLLLPDTFNYTSNNKALHDEPILRIEKGILYEGSINKKNLKGGHGSIISFLHHEYSPDTSIHFVNNVQFLANEYILYRGFTIGIHDCMSRVRREGKIDQVIMKCFIEAEGHEELTSNPLIKEAKVNMSLSRARDIGMRIAKESLDDDNNFVSTVMSGSKGDYFNIAQIMGLLGQQNLNGQRIRPQLNKGKRTLPHYSLTNELDKEEEYVSKGFIKNSFLKGLSPQEFWFHAMSGREGITDTAMKTAQSGYTQRKMVKIMEDIQIKNDQSVRNSMDSIVQFAYGGDNLCATKTTFYGDDPATSNISRLADRLNTEYEIENDTY